MAQVIAQRYEDFVDLERLRPHPDNPKTHDDEAIKESIERNGFFGAVYAQESTGFILAGHGRVENAAASGLNGVPVIWMDVDDETAKRMLLADNWITRLGAIDDAALASILQSVVAESGLEGTGYDADFLDDLLARVGEVPMLDPEEFTGGYAEDEAQQQARSAQPVATRAANGMREMMLVYPLSVYDEVMSLGATLKGLMGKQTMGEVIHAALLHTRDDLMGEEA